MYLNWRSHYLGGLSNLWHMAAISLAAKAEDKGGKVNNISLFTSSCLSVFIAYLRTIPALIPCQFMPFVILFICLCSLILPRIKPRALRIRGKNIPVKFQSSCLSLLNPPMAKCFVSCSQSITLPSSIFLATVVYMSVTPKETQFSD